MKIGDIFNYYDDAKKKYSALQVVNIEHNASNQKPHYILLALDYWAQTPLSPAEISTLVPFWKDHHSWNGCYTFKRCEGDYPENYTLVGNTAPLALPEQEITLSSWSYCCLQISLQKAWDRLPDTFKHRYKETNARESNYRQKEDDAQLPFELLSTLALTSLEVRGAQDGLIEFLASHPQVTKLTWLNCPAITIDLSATGVRDLFIDSDSLQALHLPDELEGIHFIQTIPKNLKIIPHPANRAIQIRTINTEGLEAFQQIFVDELNIRNQASTMFMKPIVSYLPHLTTLRLWGNLHTIDAIGELKRLTRLQWLTMQDVFGFTGLEFPSKAELPTIQCIWMDSVPEDAAKKVKKEFKDINLWITKGRKPNWVEANLNNPFRSWDGDEHIPAARSKKATAIFVVLSQKVSKILQENTAPEHIQAIAEELVIEFCSAFAKMSKRSDWIDTVIREQIGDALDLLLEPLEKTYPKHIKRNKIDKLFESAIDF
ncbi:hypothetical protein VQ643_11245 [Pseudomonas sp. F1_0610]|uniref:hypothetical protein n=1 Tax=Pseudomonas sp. F1_0610 TaxID=3114284 RepID=UPI0039C400D6